MAEQYALAERMVEMFRGPADDRTAQWVRETLRLIREDGR